MQNKEQRKRYVKMQFCTNSPFTLLATNPLVRPTNAYPPQSNVTADAELTVMQYSDPSL